MFRKKIVQIGWILAIGDRLRRSWICKVAHGGHLVYANQLNQDSPESVQKKICKDLMTIGIWRTFTSILDMQIIPCRPSWICKLADFEKKQDKPSEWC